MPRHDYRLLNEWEEAFLERAPCVWKVRLVGLILRRHANRKTMRTFVGLRRIARAGGTSVESVRKGISIGATAGWWLIHARSDSGEAWNGVEYQLVIPCIRVLDVSTASPSASVLPSSTANLCE